MGKRGFDYHTMRNQETQLGSIIAASKTEMLVDLFGVVLTSAFSFVDGEFCITDPEAAKPCYWSRTTPRKLRDHVAKTLKGLYDIELSPEDAYRLGDRFAVEWDLQNGFEKFQGCEGWIPDPADANEEGEVVFDLRKLYQQLDAPVQTQLDEPEPEVELDERGISLADIGIAMGNVDEEVTEFVSRFSKSGKITAQKLGKDPSDGRKRLYRLFEILFDLNNFSPLTKHEKRRLEKQLEPLLRAPNKK